MTAATPQEPRLCAIELTTREVALLLQYGYPWPGVAAQLKASRAVNGHHRVSIDRYWLEMMLADVGRSSREVRGSRLLEELDGLWGTLDNALYSHSRLDSESRRVLE